MIGELDAFDFLAARACRRALGGFAAVATMRLSHVFRLRSSAAAATVAARCNSDPKRTFSLPENGRAGSSPRAWQTWR
jgi:hypothetical protein